MTESEFARVLDVNLRGVFNGTKAVSDQMMTGSPVVVDGGMPLT